MTSREEDIRSTCKNRQVEAHNEQVQYQIEGHNLIAEDYASRAQILSHLSSNAHPNTQRESYLST